MRQVVLDTETTGLEPDQGHRIIEIGCVEIVERRLTGNRFHVYLQPDRPIDAGAREVHGITEEFLADKPRFGDIAADFVDFIRGAELIIHNAPFDVKFIRRELGLVAAMTARVAPPRRETTAEIGLPGVDCQILCTLALARKLHPGQKNGLDALCKRYAVDNSERDWHGALLDARLLADVYLAMTGGQSSLSLDASPLLGDGQPVAVQRINTARARLLVIQPSVQELENHERQLDLIDKMSTATCVWRTLAHLP